MSETLKPCPFCGNPPYGTPQDGIPKPGGGYRVNIWCDKCGASTRDELTDSEAISAWNRRAESSLAEARAEAMDEAPGEDNQPRYTTKRLRDEIEKAKAYARMEALEEAAKVCDSTGNNLVIGELPHGVCVGLAAAIRDLKTGGANG